MYTNIVFNYIKQIGEIKYLPIGINTEPMDRIIRNLDLNIVKSQFTIKDFTRELEEWGRRFIALPKLNIKDNTIITIPLAYAIKKVDWGYIANSLTHHYKNVKPLEQSRQYSDYTNEESLIYSEYILFNSLKEQLKSNAEESSRVILRPIKKTGSCYMSLLNFIYYTVNEKHLIHLPPLALDLIKQFYCKCDFINVVNNSLKKYCSKYIDNFMIFYKEKELNNIARP